MFRLVLTAVFALGGTISAAPPSIEMPGEVRPERGWVRLSPKTDAVSVTYVSLDGLEPFPSEELRDSRRFLLPVAGVSEGRYRFAAVAASKTGEQTRVDFVVIVGTAPSPTPPTPPKPDPKAELTPPLSVFIVEEGRDRTPEQARVIGNGEYWVKWRAAGNRMMVIDKDDPAVEKLELTNLVKASGLPAVIVRDSNGVSRSFKLPATIQQLDTILRTLK